MMIFHECVIKNTNDAGHVVTLGNMRIKINHEKLNVKGQFGFIELLHKAWPSSIILYLHLSIFHLPPCKNVGVFSKERRYSQPLSANKGDFGKFVWGNGNNNNITVYGITATVKGIEQTK